MKTTLALFTSLLLAGCATPYQQIGTNIAGGYSNMRLSQDVFSVKFNGNGYTRPVRARDMAMLRAADVTLEYGYSHFVILGDADHSKTDMAYVSSPTYTTGVVTKYGNTATFSAATSPGGYTIPIFKPGTELMIKCFSNVPNDQHLGRIYNASEVSAQLRVQYRIRQ